MTEPGAAADEGEADGGAANGGAAVDPLPRPAFWGFWATILWGIAILALYGVMQIAAILALADWSAAASADRSFGELIGSGMSTEYSLPLANLLTTDQQSVA